MYKEYIAYLKDNPKGYWFKRKLYGWGWTPATWQGWLLLFVFVTAILALVLRLDKNYSTSELLLSYIFPLVLLTALFIGICYCKGEKPRWQWGIPKKD